MVSFATAFLLEKDFAASYIGILLASGNLLSCAAQSVLASIADRIGGNIVKWFIAGLTAVSIAYFTSIMVLPLSGVLPDSGKKR